LSSSPRDKRFQIVRLDLPIDPAFDARVGAEPGVSLQVCAAKGADGATWHALSNAHLYHVSSARDDLPAPWFAGAPLLARCPELLAVTTFGAGYDTVDVDACTAAGVCVVNQAGSNAIAVGEHTFGLMIGLSKRIGEIDRRLRRGESFSRHQTLGFDLNGRTLGLVGIGFTGTRVAQLGAAFGMKVIASDPLLEADEIRRRGAQPVTLPELLRSADVVSLHCPLNDATRGFIDAAAFAAMKRGALFITTSRGGIHDEAALFDALKSGHLGGAGLDVWQAEPPAAQHPLLSLDNVIATNHVAGVTHDSRREMAAMGARQALALAAGARPPRLVNPEVWPAYTRRFERVFARAVAA
jgi:D-3-phosphoglycerate dehydrogenase / 2-oxoglutarate reductase